MNKLFTFTNYPTIEKEIGVIQQNQYYHFFSEKWSMHELLLYVLSFSGPVKVTLTSFSISEMAIRVFVNAMEAGYITELNCLFDKNIHKNRTNLLFFANNVVTRIHLSRCHAKVILFENDNWKIVVNGSANFTINPRYEAGMICSVPDAFLKYQTEINKAFENSQNIYEYINRTTQTD